MPSTWIINILMPCLHFSKWGGLHCMLLAYLESEWCFSFQSILCAGLYTNIAATETGLTSTVLSTLKRQTGSGSGDRPWWYDGRREVHIHPSSINSGSRIFKHPFVVFLEKVNLHLVSLALCLLIACLLLEIIMIHDVCRLEIK